MSDSLKEVKRLAIEAKNIDLDIADLEERLSSKKEQKRVLLEKKIPDLLLELGMPSLEVSAQGNLPGFKVEIAPFYDANIAVGWAEPKRKAAFQALRDHDAGDLIKQEVSLTFHKGQDDVAQKVLASLKEQGLKPSVKETVHQATLKAWLKERITSGEPTPDLDLIGGRVGSKAKLKDI